MPNVLGLIAVGACGLFAGAALYINLVEHPSRMSCGIDVALRQWAPSYKRAAVLQASLAMLGGVAGLSAWASGGGRGFLLGARCLLAVVPFTLLVVFPTNRSLLDLHAAGRIGNAEKLLNRWNALHAVRTAWSLIGFLVMLLALRR